MPFIGRQETVWDRVQKNGGYLAGPNHPLTKHTKMLELKKAMAAKKEQPRGEDGRFLGAEKTDQ